MALEDNPRVDPEKLLRRHVRTMLPRCGELDGCCCRGEGDRPCEACLRYLKFCYIDLDSLVDLERLCSHGLAECERCNPPKRRRKRVQ